MKKIILMSLLSSVFCYSYGQNNFPTSGDAFINASIPLGHAGGYNALWMPNASALMPENAPAYAGIMLTANVIRSGATWSSSNSSLPAWKLYMGYGPTTDFFYISRSAPGTYTEQSLFKITNAGNVGIGTTTPNALLHVTGTVVLAGNNANIDPAITSRNPSYLANTGQMLIGWNRTGGAGEIDFIGNQGGGGTGGFAFYNHDNNNNETQLMWILGNGQVLIGNSQGKQGSYMLAVAGSAVATSFTVKALANWPDYVFKPDYTLPTLTEVKTYIDQNHHLPEIQSAEQIEKDGLNLGEMNKLLVKKVEELTLYLIEKDDQLKKQDKINIGEEEKLKQQQAQIYALNKKVELLLNRIAE